MIIDFPEVWTSTGYIWNSTGSSIKFNCVFNTFSPYKDDLLRAL